jgi:hypothetical protein
MFLLHLADWGKSSMNVYLGMGFVVEQLTSKRSPGGLPRINWYARQDLWLNVQKSASAICRRCRVYMPSLARSWCQANWKKSSMWNSSTGCRTYTAENTQPFYHKFIPTSKVWQPLTEKHTISGRGDVARFLHRLGSPSGKNRPPTSRSRTLRSIVVMIYQRFSAGTATQRCYQPARESSHVSRVDCTKWSWASFRWWLQVNRER